MAGIYIHIPFCSGKCNYCDFVSFENKNAFKDMYVDALAAEMKLFNIYGLDTLYIGGGTPSELTAGQLMRLFEAVEQEYKPVRWFDESTFEANPESLSAEKIALLKQTGIKRISMGLQSADDEILKYLGRRHDFNKFKQVYNAVRKEGFQSVNADLITGIPGQSMQIFKQTLSNITALAPEHISLYALSVESGTKFYKDAVIPNDELSADMFFYAKDELEKAGYVHYEISNFAKPGHESKHNLNYWDNGEYIGLGCSASSHVRGLRRTNDPNLESYCNAMLGDWRDSLFSVEELTGKEKLGETVMLGLRKLKGIAVTEEMLAAFSKQFENLRAQELIYYDGKAAKLTRKGLYLSNNVFREFVAPFD